MATKYENYITGDDDLQYAYGVEWRAMSFTPSTAHGISSVKLKIRRVGSPGTVTVSIRATSGGWPTGADLTSGTTDGDALTTSAFGEWKEITLTPYTLSAATEYAIVIRAPSGVYDVDQVEWRRDTTGTYTGGGCSSSTDSGASWAEEGGGNPDGVTVDYMFEDWGEEDPLVTTQTCADVVGVTATGRGNIVNLGGSSVTAHGHCWAETADPTTALTTKTDNGAASAIGTFTSAMTSLTPGTGYYTRAYAKNTTGTSYGANVYFIASVDRAGYIGTPDDNLHFFDINAVHRVTINTTDVDDTPVDAATTAPISSNWAYDMTATVAAKDYGLSFEGIVTTATDTTHFKVSTLADKGTGFFKPASGTPYEIYVVEADGAAPEGEQTPVIAYTTADGTFQHAAFTAQLAVGDVVLIQHPLIASLGTKATPAATGAVTTDDYAMAYQKQAVKLLLALENLTDDLETLLLDENYGLEVFWALFNDLVTNAEDIVRDTAQLEHMDFGDCIYFDSVCGTEGTAYPLGTPTNPVNSMADAKTIADALNLHCIRIHGAATIPSQMEHYTFLGHRHEALTDYIDLNGQDVDGCHFEGLLVKGAQVGAGFINIKDCIVHELTNFTGMITNSAFYASTCSLEDIGYADIDSCYSIYGAVTLTVRAPTRASIKDWKGNLILTAQDGGTMNLRGFTGTLEIDAMTSGTLSVYAQGADITINGDCSGGTINLYGIGKVTGAGGGVAISDYLIDTKIDAVQADLGDVADTAHVTFPSAVATGLAYLKGQQIAQGLCYYADITGYTDTTHFASTTLAGFETGFFIGWACFLIRDSAGAGATPQGAKSLVTGFTTSTGAIVLASALPSAGASGDQIMLVHPALMDAWNLKGGVDGIQDIIENQNAELDTARGKITITMDGNEQDLYGESSDTEFHLEEFRVDLHNMAEGDTIVFRVYTTEDGTEKKISSDLANTFTGAQDDPARVEIIGSANQVWGREDISVTAEQTGVTNSSYREIVCYWRDSKRGS